MDVEEFEQNILELAFETDVRITTASVAYYLGIPSTEAEPMLEELLERGVLELDSDSEGNLYYRVVDAAAHHSSELSQLRHERMAGVDGGTGEVEADTDPVSDLGEEPEGPHLIGDATVDGAADGEAFSPSSSAGAGVERGARADGGEPAVRDSGGTTGRVGDGRVVRGEEAATNERGRRDPAHFPAFEREESSSPRRDRADNRHRRTKVAESRDPLAGVTRTRGATDAVVDSCGDDPLVVQSEARCEPRPLADSDPVVASCSEQSSSRQTSLVPRGRRSGSVGHVNEARAAAAGTTAAASSMVHQGRETHLDRPEHQPGMSLLLSLILCGTGQIYNGEVSKGIMMMVLCFLLWFVLLGWVVHIWSIVDSVVVAERINRKSDGG